MVFGLRLIFERLYPILDVRVFVFIIVGFSPDVGAP